MFTRTIIIYFFVIYARSVQHTKNTGYVVMIAGREDALPHINVL